MINLQCKLAQKRGHTIILRVSWDLDPDHMFSDPDPAPLKQIISDPNGSGPAPQRWLIGIGSDLETPRNGSRAGKKIINK